LSRLATGRFIAKNAGVKIGLKDLTDKTKQKSRYSGIFVLLIESESFFS